MAPASTVETRWRELIREARSHAAAPGRAPGKLAQARERLKNQPWPVSRDKSDEWLWGALIRLCEAFFTGEFDRRRALTVALESLAAACLDYLDGPAPIAAAQAEPPRLPYRADIDG